MTDPAAAEARAAALLPPHVRDYFAAGAGSEAALRESVNAWSAVRFRPKVLTDVSVIDTTTSLLGTPVQTPIMIAPMAQQLAAHPDGERAMAIGAAAAGSLIGVSTHTAVRFADIAETGCPWWFQVYVMRDRSLTELLVRRAVAQGARAIILTVDMVALLPSAVNPRDWPDGPGKARHANLTAAERRSAGQRGLETDPSIGFESISWLREISGLPVLVKGVLRADDAIRCVDAGADGLIVSTHGGRRMGPSVSSAAALPEIVAAVAERVEIYADSGLRSAEHVAAALALGAKGVFLGRLALWTLISDGPLGIEHLMTGLTAELRHVMMQLGVATLTQFRPDLLVCQPGNKNRAQSLRSSSESP